MKFLAIFITDVALATMLFAAPAEAAEPKGMWDKPVTTNPFDKKPFRPIAVPEWLKETTRMLYCINICKSYDEAKRVGVQMSELPLVDPSWCRYDSKYLERDPKGDKNEVADEIGRYKKIGLKVIGSIPPWIQVQIYKKHPEWRMIPTNTTTIPDVDYKQSPYGGAICQIGPWGDQMIEIMAEALHKFPDIDGFSFDGIHHSRVCYCKHCRDSYRKDTGKEIPNVNMDDLEFRTYLLWYDKQMEDFIVRMQKRIKGINPNVALVSWTTNAGRWGHFLDIPHSMSARMNLLFDAPCQEFWLDETNRGNSVVPAFANAYIWAVSNHRVAFSEPYIFSHGNPYGTDSFPPLEMLRRDFLVMTWGPNSSQATLWPNLKQKSLDNIGEMTCRAPWMTHKKPEAWAAMVMSDCTRNMYGRDPGKLEDKYMSNVLGFFRTGLEEHMPITVIEDWNLTAEDLAKYKVLILPNTACLSDDQANAVREFVKNGGGLVATIDASLFDELGTQRKDFALSDVFGVTYKGIPKTEVKKEELDINFVIGLGNDYWEKRKSIFDMDIPLDSVLQSERLKSYMAPGQRLCFKGQANYVEPINAKASTSTLGALYARIDNAKPFPAYFTNTYGKGKVVYFGAGVDSAYYLYPYPYQRLLMAQAVRWVAPEAQPITVEAPMCIHSTFYRQEKDGQRLVVQLFNDLNSSGNHAKPDEDIPLHEEVVPVHDIKVSFQGYGISRVHLEPEGIDLPIVKSGDTAQVTVPKIEIHSMVVAELQ